MADDESSTSSPLSLQSSEAFEANDGQMAITDTAIPPAKRQRIGESARDSVPYSAAASPTGAADDFISSDSEGDVPNSPGNMRQDDDDIHEQVTACHWVGCDAGDLGNMDNLVDHIHNEHVETRSKKYTCEWSDCQRKSLPHASAYALKAHMRSHTKEKPFYCELPECDRSFTRSDALQKHYRTVHETEALRPSDPIPKSMQAKQSMLSARVKEPMKESHPHYDELLPHPTKDLASVHNVSGWASSFPSDLGFTVEEEARESKELHRLLRRQLHWAEEEAESLKRSCEILEELRKREWVEKEILLEQALKTELDWHQRRNLVLYGGVDIPSAGVHAGNWIPPNRGVNSPVPIPGKAGDDKEAAAVLASIAQV